MFTGNASSSLRIVRFGVVLTWSAGFIDAVGYLTLAQIYSANMSGNTVAVAIHFSKGNWLEAWKHVCPLLAFFPGLIAGDSAVRLLRVRGVKTLLMPTLLIEIALLGIFAGLVHHLSSMPGGMHDPSTAIYALLVGLIAFAMGLQNGALRRVGGLKDVHTYVTGTLLAAANGCTEFLFWLARRLSRHPGRVRLRRVLKYTRRQRSLRNALRAGMLWTAYITGAMVGAFLLLSLGIDVLWIPISVMAILGVFDYFKPVSIQNARTEKPI